ncbi:hypothetical protein EH223_07590 [candidate division KSB1 bacterium]|nr:alginate export family protein [candidate division KSB1 bacterium]RQW04406.1 MAG: hypothetical protein EH223_07590 [candidate division KSB1 bacterium]
MRRVTIYLTRVVCAVVLLSFASQLIAQPSFKWGFRERLRHTYMNNNMDFNADRDDEQGFFRVRTNLWGDVTFTQNLALRVMLTNEFRPYTIVRESDEAAGKEMTFDEIVFDNLYLSYTTGGENPISVILGRQNLIYGEGFILLEGAPWDGSRTIYHDALKISVKRDDITADFLAISNPEYDDRLPKINFSEKGGKYLGLPKNADGDQMLNDGVEEALGFYLTSKPPQGTQIEGYLFYKTERPNPVIGYNGNPAAGPVQPTERQLRTLYLNTIGGRITQPITERLNLTTEWAYQAGEQGDDKISAYGGYANLSYTIVPKKKGVLTAGINVMSGDDPATEDVEGWNPLFSRWPKWSELYIYSHTAENIGGARKVAYWTNTWAPNIKLVMDLFKKVNVTLWLHNLNSFYAQPDMQNPMMENAALGKSRGNEIQLWLKFQFFKGLTGHFLYDYFIAGDFYPEPRANASFIRFELMYAFQSK